jgi:hypothetical protein
VSKVFLFLRGGGYIGIVKTYSAGFTFKGFYTFIAIVLKSFVKILDGGSTLRVFRAV